MYLTLLTQEDKRVVVDYYWLPNNNYNRVDR
jgi:hypothetical protein